MRDRVGVGHHRKRIGQLDREHLVEHGADQLLHQRANLDLAEKRGFDVDLRELRLPVGAQVFVAKALDDLVVPIKPGHHQQLLEQLR